MRPMRSVQLAGIASVSGAAEVDGSIHRNRMEPTTRRDLFRRVGTAVGHLGDRDFVGERTLMSCWSERNFLAR